jgi:phospholipase D1/2
LKDTNAQKILLPGDTCWQAAKADRYALIVDAADYFRALKAAILKARHRVLLIGWDFDARVKLEPGGPTMPGPNRIGSFLNWAAKHHEGLEIGVLKWDLGVLLSMARGSTPLFIINWLAHRHVRFRLDSSHPLAGAQHQKIVVVDDAVAFCGGIDVTVGRWDRRAHKDHDPERLTPGGKPAIPWHDASVAVDGEAARALGDLARFRWLKATGEYYPPVPSGSDPWPDHLEPTARHVTVGISRTFPEYADQKETREVEAIYLKAIMAARETIYIESQYFTSRRIAEALAARLDEADGPEIVVINPVSAEGWLEAAKMNSARAKLARMVMDRDREKRFKLLYPVTEGGQPIYVHAKIMIVDDVLLKVGSSNISNRSLGLDSECDISFEAETDAERRLIRNLRDDLLAEHLARPSEVIAAAIDSSGSLIRAIESLIGEGKSLRPLHLETLSAFEELLSDEDLFDPERPPTWRSLFFKRKEVFR